MKRTHNYLTKQDEFKYCFKQTDLEIKSLDDGQAVLVWYRKKCNMVGYVSGRKTIYPFIGWNTHIDCRGQDYSCMIKDESRKLQCYEIAVQNKNGAWGKRIVLEKDIKGRWVG